MSELSARRIAREALSYEDQELYMKDLVTGIQEFMAIKEDEEARETARMGFQELVELTQADTYTVALGISNNEDDARDIVQDVYVKVFRALPKFSHSSQFSTWLYRITRNASYTYVKKRGYHRHDPIESVPNDVVIYDARIQQQVENGQLRDRLIRALRKLNDSRRPAVVHRYIHDLPHVSSEYYPQGKSVTKELGITESASKLRSMRGLEQVRVDLEKDEKIA